jgi:glycosyltransferase involved in cell wall biosynthesis
MPACSEHDIELESSASRYTTMKIALIITSLTMGGAETQVVDLADRLDAMGHEVLVLSLTDELVMMPKRPTVQVRSLYMKKTLVSLVSAYRIARNMLTAFDPDVVHSHMVHANIFSRLLRLRKTMKRLICTAHSTNEGSAFWMWAYRLTDWLAHITTNVSQEALDRAISRGAVPVRKVMLVYNGIDCDRYRFDPAARKKIRETFSLPESTQVLLAAGRFCEAKDYPNLLKAYAEVSARRDDCVLWIAGAADGKEHDQANLEALASELGVRSKVEFLGFRRDVNALMNGADIFVLSSAWEGFPLVIGEAMACERVVVSTDAGGVREWLGDSPLVVPTCDSAALARALLRALDMETDTRLAHGRSARNHVLTSYSLDAIAARWEQIYRGHYGTCLSGTPATHE